MKLFNRFFLLLLFILLPVGVLHADPVGEGRALEAARAFFQRDDNRALRMAPLQRVSLERAPLTKAAAAADPSYYVFNRAGGGFVIIAGDDACAPVLGYSFTGRFGTGDDMPYGLRSWLEDLEEQVAIARSEGPSSRQAFSREWSEILFPTKSSVSADFKPAVKYETPIWGQGTPFNNLAPMVGDSRAVAGCVPLAMSMLCRFFTYPLKGTGTLPSYNYSPESGMSITIEGYELGHIYDWANIKMDYTKGYNDAEAEAVSRLVYDCGVMAQVTFDKSTSGNINTMARKAIDHLGFDAGAVGVSRNYYTDARWLDLLKTELQDHPVLYSARREDSGHAFLVDGYDSSDFLSVNWGWSGDSNGYYRLEAFAPNAQRQYLYKHGAILGLKPDAGGKTQEYLYLLSGKSSSGVEFHGLEASGPIVGRKDFIMKFGGLCNGGNESFEGYFILALCDANGNVRDYVCGSQLIDPLQPRYWRGYSEISCHLNRFPNEGDVIKPFYRSISWPDDDWREFLYDKTDGTVETVPVFDKQTLAQATDITYSTTLGEVTVDTKDDVDWSLTSATGSSMASFVTYSITQMVIRADEMPKGTYTLTLKRGNDQVKINLKMGKK